MKKLFNIALYVVLGAGLFAFVFSALGALFEGEALAKTLGEVGAAVGAVVAVAVGAERNFQ